MNEIFNCEINSLLDKFFDAPEYAKKPEAAPAEEEDDEDKVTHLQFKMLRKCRSCRRTMTWR